MKNENSTLFNLGNESKVWVVTGAAGFIGSHLVERLLKLNQVVLGFDNFSTGDEKNLELVKLAVGPAAFDKFHFIRGDVSCLADIEKLDSVCQTVDFVLHQAALGSVPRSMLKPMDTFQSNLAGFINVLEWARNKKAKRLVYASSSSVYGDNQQLPKVEDLVGRVLSPYAASKKCNEVLAEGYSAAFGMEIIGLRYFNVFGPRQNPNGPYSAVIPRWIHSLKIGEPIIIYGDGTTSRDFCFIENVISANLKAATEVSVFSKDDPIKHFVANVAYGETTTLNDLFKMLIETFKAVTKKNPPYLAPIYEPFRKGDIQHSLASLSQIQNRVGFTPTHSLRDGLKETLESFF